MNRRKILRQTGYGAFAALSLLLSFYLTFPAEALAQRLAFEVRRQSGGAWTVSHTGASTWHLSGIAMEGVTLTRQAPGSDPWKVSFDALRARLRLLPLFLLRLSVDAEAQLGSGVLSARYTGHGKEAADLRLQAHDVDLNTPPVLGQLAGLPLGGKLNGTVDVRLDSDAKNMAGQADLQFKSLVAGPGSVQGFSLPTVALGELDLALELKNSQAKITTFKQSGGNLSVQGRGTAQVRQPLPASSIDACLQFRADAAFLEQNPKIKTALQIAEVQLRKDPQGYLNLPLAGSLMGGVRVNPGFCR